MKPLNDAKNHHSAAICLVARVVLGFTCACGGAMAQSADIFEKQPVEQEQEHGTTEKKDLPPPAPVDSMPSRFAGADYEQYVAARAAVFSMRNRASDPFALLQDPNAEPPVKKNPSALPSKRQAALPPTPLAEIIKLIRVTAIMPGDNTFLVGVRPFKAGEEFPLSFQGKTLKMKVMEVSAKRILFRDLEKNEDAALETGMLPPGMVLSGGSDLRPPGMVSPLDDVPLELESGRSNNPTE